MMHDDALEKEWCMMDCEEGKGAGSREEWRASSTTLRPGGRAHNSS